MRRLLQFGISLFLLVMFLAPLAELFDRWEAPRLSNDTEFGEFSVSLRDAAASGLLRSVIR